MNIAFTRFIVIMACFASALVGYAGTAQAENAPSPEWNVSLVGSGAFNLIGDMTIDQQGNAYVTGWKNNPLTTMAVAKLSPSGEVLWTSYGNSYPGYHCIGNKIKADAYGNSYVTGYGCYSGTGRAMFAAKFSPEGEMLWLSRYIVTDKGVEYAGTGDIAVDSTGNVYMTGGVQIYYSGGQYYNRLITVKFDPHGATLWVRQYNLFTIGFQLAVGSDDSIFVLGTQGVCVPCTPDTKWLLLRYDQAGNLTNEQVVPIQGTPFPPKMIQDAEGNIYVTGTSGPSGNEYYTIIKYNSEGDQLWIARRERESRVSGISLTSAAVDNNDGSLYLTGSITLPSGSGGKLLKLDSEANFLWSKDVGTYLSIMSDVRLDSYGNVYVAGRDYNTNYIRKFDASGKVLWYLRHAYPSAFISMRLWNNGQGIYVSDVLGVRKFKSANQIPVAAAGPDRTVECVGPDGASVTLDGSGSTDPDGDALTYAWTWNGGTASGVGPTITLPLGTTTVTLTVDDGNGGTSTDTVDIIVRDTTPPATSAIFDGVMGNNGWYISDVSVTLTSTDGCSGVKEVRYTLDGNAAAVNGDQAAFTISTDGIHGLSFNAKDNAGNGESVTAVTVNIDKTGPVITATVSPPANTNGWHNTDVTVTFECSDSLSGIAECPQPIVVTTEGAGQVITGTAVDKAGNTASTSVTLNIDKTSPAADISVTPGLLRPPNHKMVDVAVNGGATDTTSGVATIKITVQDEYGTVEPSVSGFNTTIPLEAWRNGGDKDGRHYTITAVITDNAGNTTTVATEAVCPHDMRGKK